MPRPPFFGEATPKVLGFIQRLSEYHRKKRTQLTLTTLAQRVQDEFSSAPSLSKEAVAERQREYNRRRKAKGQPPEKRDEEDALRHIIFKLLEKHKVWFGSIF